MVWFHVLLTFDMSSGGSLVLSTRYLLVLSVHRGLCPFLVMSSSGVADDASAQRVQALCAKVIAPRETTATNGKVVEYVRTACVRRGRISCVRRLLLPWFWEELDGECVDPEGL